MGSKNLLDKAMKYLRAGKYPIVISLLEPLVIEYRDSFKFYYILGVACMYAGDMGGAETYYKRARQIKINSPELMVAQGTLFLQRGEKGRAVEYYLEALEYDPSNKVAKRALQFIRCNSTDDHLLELIHTRVIKKFYPPLGIHPSLIPSIIIITIISVLCIFFAFNYKKMLGLNGVRADLSNFTLSVEEKSNSLETDIATNVYKYILTSSEVASSYRMAQHYFQQYKDNQAQIEINRILNSNASSAIKQKSRLLMEYLDEPGFDTLSDNIPYKEVAADPYLYMDCWVSWSGRITNVESLESIFNCDFLVGYENMERIDGIVPISIKQPFNPETDKPLKVLGRVDIMDGKLHLSVKSVYQPVIENK